MIHIKFNLQSLTVITEIPWLWCLLFLPFFFFSFFFLSSFPMWTFILWSFLKYHGSRTEALFHRSVYTVSLDNDFSTMRPKFLISLLGCLSYMFRMTEWSSFLSKLFSFLYSYLYRLILYSECFWIYSCNSWIVWIFFSHRQGLIRFLKESMTPKILRTAVL